MSNYDGKIEPLPTYNNQGNEKYLSSDKPDTCLWLAEENTKQAKQIERLQDQLKEANEVIKWYDGLENILIGWELCTGQPKGTANKYLEKWGAK